MTTIHTADVVWQRDGADFCDNRYSRRHRLRFDGGLDIPASASPHVVPPPLSDAAAVDPEEAFVAALASCHMLWFLSLAAEQGFRVDRYHDAASGELAPDASGRLAMTTVTLRPQADFSGHKQPTPDDLRRLHEAAHDRCFLAASVRSEVRCLPVFPPEPMESEPC